MGNPYQSSATSGTVYAVSPQVPYFKAWLLFFLLATVGGGLVGMLIGGALGAVLGASGVPVIQIGLITGGVGFLIGVPISFFSFKWAVGKYIVAPIAARTS